MLNEPAVLPRLTYFTALNFCFTSKPWGKQPLPEFNSLII
jgi:hypothetical protein